MKIRDQIEIILKKRKEKVSQLKERKEHLKKICSLLEDCDHLYNGARQITDSELRGQYLSLFASLPTDTMREELQGLVGKYEEAVKRFDRDYISIATVGKERQGKSCFLQAVGNLDNLIIPAYNSTSCTGATSVIYNRPEMPEGTVEAVIKFRKREKLLEIVKGYLDAIDSECLHGRQLDFDMLGTKSFKLTVDTLAVKPGEADKGVALNHLRRIIEHFGEIRDLYGQGDLVLRDKGQIAEYVAQNNGVKLGDPGHRDYYKYLAVEKADIYCPFYEDCGSLVLVDTIGLGDTQYGIEEAMLETVDKECDAAIVVTMPMSGVQESDLKLYNSLKERFQRRDMSKWLFYLANKNVGVSDNRVDAFVKGIREGNFSVCYCETADCSDFDEVRDNFMNPLLERLLGNMDDIDAAYLTELEETEAVIRKKYEVFVSELPEARTFDASVQQGLSAAQKGKECYRKLTADLVNCVIYWGQERNQPNSILWNAVQEILDSLDDLVPDAQTLQLTINGNGSLLPGQLWDDALHYVRNEVTDRFIAIDSILEEETRKFKNSLVRSLYDELLNLSKAQGITDLPWEEQDGGQEKEPDMVEWLKNIMDHVINDKPQYEQIYKAFRFMYRFEFNTRAQLIQEVRKQLYIINPICDREYAKPLYDFHRDNAGKEVNFYLTSRMSIIEENLRHVLVDLYHAPNQAFYAAAEEFYDRLTFANSLNESEFESMQDVWGKFFMEYSSQLWTASSEKYQQANELVREYRNIKKELEMEDNVWRQ